jgi:hypothetical protein
MIALAQPWALLVLAGIPAVVALHLLRRRLAPVPVSGLFLWGGRRALGQGGRTVSPLHRRRSLWLECLAVAIAALAMADPHLAGSRSAGHAALVVDGHWRLQARDADGSAWERARMAAAAWAAALPPGTRLTVVASGPVPRLLAGPGAEPAALAPALLGFLPDAPRHELAAAVDLARDLAPGAPVTVLTDRDPGLGDGLIATGRAMATSGWAGAHRAADGTLWARAAADPALPPRPWRLVDADGAVRAAGTIAADTGPVRLPAMAGAADLILDGPDPLAVDDRLRIPALDPEPIRVRIDLPAGTRLDAATRRAFAAAGAVGDQLADIEVGLGSASVAAGVWRLSFIAGTGAAVAGPFAARSGHPLVAGIDTTGLVVAAPGAAGPGDEVLWRAGTAAVLAVRRQPGRAVEILLRGDWERSTWERHPAWPALAAALVQGRRAARPGPRQPVLAPGGTGTAVVPPGQTARLTGAATMALVADADGLAVIPPLTPGEWIMESGDRRWPIRVDRLDPVQADLSSATTAVRPAAGLGALAVARPAGELALWLAALGLVLVLAWSARRQEDGA